MLEDRYAWISRRAHEIWEQEGYPNGRDQDHWSMAAAEREEFEHMSMDIVLARRSNDISPRPRTILIVDDEPLIRFATVDALEQAGYEVVEAGNADEALVLLGRKAVDVLFTDINMPGSMDGLQLVSRVRERSPKTRMVVTSGHVHLGRFDLASGVAFLPKPYQYDSLIKLLEELLA